MGKCRRTIPSVARARRVAAKVESRIQLPEKLLQTRVCFNRREAELHRGGPEASGGKSHVGLIEDGGRTPPNARVCRPGIDCALIKTR
jgi:hypothetical protein